MIHAKRALVFLLLATLVVGCARIKSSTKMKSDIPESTVELQDINLNTLQAMIANLDAEIAAVKQVPSTQYPLYEQLRATDLAGMEARKELMVLLAEHCRFSKEKLLEAEKYPERKQQILGEWSEHRRRMAIVLDAADKKVDELERKRVGLEFDLIEAALKKD